MLFSKLMVSEEVISKSLSNKNEFIGVHYFINKILPEKHNTQVFNRGIQQDDRILEGLQVDR